jgi:hypothetical protein
MSLDSREMESKAQMLVNDPGYVVPEDIQGVPRARIEGRASVIRNQNNAIARFNRAPAPALSATQVPSTMGGKRRKSKRSKKRKSKRIKRKSRR